MTTFCWLPPEREETGRSTPWVRTSNSATRRSASARTAAGRICTALPAGATSYRLSTMFSATENGPTSPSVERSSGTKPTPARMIWRVDRPISSRPSRVTEPVALTRPMIASVSSVCPLPCTPATARTSPWRTAKDTASSSTWPVGETTERSSTRNVSSPRVGAVLRRSRTTFRPTMRAASSAASAEGSAVPTTRPRRSTVMSSETALTSRSLWEMNTIAVPSARSCRMMPSSSSVSWGVSTAVGSSRMRMRASRTRALMISTRCCTPTGRSSTTASGSTSKPYCAEISRIRRRVASRSSTPRARVCSSPRATFSATVKTGTSMKCWCTMPMPARMASPGPENRTGSPSSRISPSVGS